MNYSMHRDAAAKLLKQCNKLGLPAWVQAFAEQQFAYAAHWWRISRDKANDKDDRTRGNEKAVRALCFLHDMLGAFWISTRPKAAVLLISVVDRDGRGHSINPESITRVDAAKTKSRFSEARSVIEIRGGALIQCRQTPQEVRRLMGVPEADQLRPDPA